MLPALQHLGPACVLAEWLAWLLLEFRLLGGLLRDIEACQGPLPGRRRVMLRAYELALGGLLLGRLLPIGW